MWQSGSAGYLIARHGYDLDHRLEPCKVVAFGERRERCESLLQVSLRYRPTRRAPRVRSPTGSRLETRPPWRTCQDADHSSAATSPEDDQEVVAPPWYASRRASREWSQPDSNPTSWVRSLSIRDHAGTEGMVEPTLSLFRTSHSPGFPPFTHHQLTTRSGNVCSSFVVAATVVLPSYYCPYRLRGAFPDCPETVRSG